MSCEPDKTVQDPAGPEERALLLRRRFLLSAHGCASNADNRWYSPQDRERDRRDAALWTDAAAEVASVFGLPAELPGEPPAPDIPSLSGPVRVVVTRGGDALDEPESCLDIRGTEAFVVVRGSAGGAAGPAGRTACTLGYAGPPEADLVAASRGRAMAWLAVTEALSRDSAAPEALRRLCSGVLGELARGEQGREQP